MKVLKDIHKEKEFWKFIIQMIVPVACLLVMFGYASIKGWGSNKVKDAMKEQALLYKVDSLRYKSIDQQKQINEVNIEVKDFKETMIDYAQRQDKMYREVKDIQRLQTKILSKIDKKVDAAGDLIEELKDRETAKEQVIKNNK